MSIGGEIAEKIHPSLFNKSVILMKSTFIHPDRIRRLQDGIIGSGPIIYWMHREQRIFDNWALFFALSEAKRLGKSLRIVFGFDLQYTNRTLRQVYFTAKSLQEVQSQAHTLGIHFDCVLTKDIPVTLSKYLEEIHPALLVTDFMPLREVRDWKQKIAENITCPLFQVDAHNIIPAWTISQKQEFQAATLRPKVNRLLPVFLDVFPEFDSYRIGDMCTGAENNFVFQSGCFPQEVEEVFGEKEEYIPKELSSTDTELFPSENVSWYQVDFIDFEYIIENIITDRTILPVLSWIPGFTQANKILKEFISDRIGYYDSERNNPNKEAQSELSPYLHYGNIAPQRVALTIDIAEGFSDVCRADFLEELIVRREVAENYCYYSPNYDTFSGAWKWAQESLIAHWNDTRDWVYSLDQFENADTHDTLWNAAQNELIKRGKMHGFMRMYWAKKILEWSKNPDEAIRIAVYLNDTYALDGQDPNGYTGIMWSICGIHDRPWFDRPVYGKIRYMNRSGCEKKFDIGAYVARWGDRGRGMKRG